MDAAQENTAQSQPAAQAPNADLESCARQLDEARRQAEEFKDKYLRAAAEVENARKQAERDAATRVTEEKRRFLREFLEVADNLEMALSVPSDKTDLIEGVRLALQQLQQVLRRHGVERMAVQAGDTFDPVFHDAVEVRPGNEPHDKVVEVVRSGYLYNGTVLRPAQVIVARGQRQ